MEKRSYTVSASTGPLETGARARSRCGREAERL